ncbi:hypothetical protein HHI36_002909 [Cryptolaemus montrouzieri]|uniref:RRM domain-containing protein n=1 Tax=Cryptolaemus montrouzieri TaxID=559131 RepID=A0ABD2PC09_9CUCU
MDTSLNKTPKKRKSLANQKTPGEKETPKAKILKESPASKQIISNASSVQIKKEKSPKKSKKSQDTNSKKSSSVKVKKEKLLNKQDFLLQKLKERSDKEGKEVVIKSLNEKIDQILSRSEVTKTGKRKIKLFKKLIASVSGEQAPKSTNTSVKNAQNLKKKGKTPQPAKNLNKPNNESAKKANSKKKAAPIKEEDDEDEESSDSEHIDIKPKKVKVEVKKEDSSNDDENELDEEESEDGSEEEEEDGDDNEEENGEDSDEESEEEPQEEVKPKVNKKQQVKKEANPIGDSPGGKKSRYVLFVGNLAYDVTKKELEQHFSTIATVVDVRIPTDKESNKPRGFAYVELPDEASYQKALDLNGSQLKNRKIKVEYTQGGKKKGEDAKKKSKLKILNYMQCESKDSLDNTIKGNKMDMQNQNLRNNQLVIH